MPRVITAFIAATYAGGLEEAWGEVWGRPHGIVKGSVHGDLRTFALPFSEQIRSSEFGFTSINYIPAFLSNEFSELMSSISNCATKVVAYNETTNEGLIKASITLHRSQRLGSPKKWGTFTKNERIRFWYNCGGRG